MAVRKGIKKKEVKKDLTLNYTIEITDTVKNVGDNYDVEDIKKALELLLKKRLKVDDLKIKSFKVFPIEQEE